MQIFFFLLSFRWKKTSYMKKIQEIEINVQTNVIKWKILILEKK